MSISGGVAAKGTPGSFRLDNPFGRRTVIPRPAAADAPADPQQQSHKPLRLSQKQGSRRRMAGQILAGFGVLALIGGLLTMAGSLLGGQAPSSGAKPVSAAGTMPLGWIEIRRPFQLYALAGTDFSKLPATYTALRHPQEDGRVDLLRFGDPRGQGGSLTLLFYRVGAEAQPQPGFVDELSQSAAAAQLWFEAARPTKTLLTRFGTFETTELRLVAGSAQNSCLGFRGDPDLASVVRISGFACNPGNKSVISQETLACVIDRLDLVAASDDTRLQSVFAEAERRRGPRCMLAPPAAKAQDLSWLNGTLKPPSLKTAADEP